jgi:hypothetical protein
MIANLMDHPPIPTLDAGEESLPFEQSLPQGKIA